VIPRLKIRNQLLCFLILTVTCLLVIIAGCEQKKESIYSNAWYEGWQLHACDTVPVMIFYPPSHPHADAINLRCSQYQTSVSQVCRLLDMTPPTDTLVVFYYTGYGQGRQMTQRMYPFLQDSIIHFWHPSYLGPTLMDWLLPHWVAEKPPHAFFWHGLRSLFDFSGQNYHWVTYERYYSDDFLGLEGLMSDTAIDSNKERFQSAEAASFCAYALARAGAAGLKRLYRSSMPADSMLRLEFNMSVDSVEREWIGFAATYVSDSVKQAVSERVRNK
jgi:hypothetical protein